MATILIITLNLMSDDGSAVAHDENFTLENLAGINTKTATAVTGKWSSSSPYLGADFGGSYYVTKELLGPEKDWGTSVLKPGGNLVDPSLPVEARQTERDLLLNANPPTRFTVDLHGKRSIGKMTSGIDD